MPQRSKTSRTDLVFAALANPTRRDVLDLLLDGPRPVQDIADHFDMTRPSVSEHLKVLRDAGLVVQTRSGRERHYAVEPEPLRELIRLAHAVREVLARPAHGAAPDARRGHAVTDPRAIHVDEFLPHPPARVWCALVEPDQLARWLMPNDFKPVVGHRFTITAKPIPATGFSGTVHCQVLDLQPERLLSISWTDTDGNRSDAATGGSRDPAVPGAPRLRPRRSGSAVVPEDHGRLLAQPCDPPPARGPQNVNRVASFGKDDQAITRSGTSARASA